MSDEKKSPETDATPASGPIAGEAGPASAADVSPADLSDASPQPDTAQLQAIVKALQDEIDGLTDGNLRIRAEMENLRKRFEREKVETSKYAITKFAQDVVNIGDNFQRAISAVPAGAAERDPALKSFLDGVLLAEREFIIVLERHGVIRIDPKGEPFNPKIHNAVMEKEDKGVPAGTVIQVFQSGYMIEERCLKPALVVVARGGAKVSRGTADGEPKPATDGPAGEPPAREDPAA